MRCFLVMHSSYGSVFTALHKKTNRTVAIKVVPVDSDINDLMREISILKGCKSDYVVRYYGSYYKDNDIWVIGSFWIISNRLLWNIVLVVH